ncbi:lysophospholipid acyltransferase family protein [Parvibium lacunae]|uniref:1-acyl-sn-glycerol-3-phosphate acyltransferase n=1 Tax=Parvibium lacunae TaxID=1888893 RepID=A0A368L481_9BURK|nr:lysophospholipid acyltransferase family protein [Parvibium lacunae]RCS58384.1 1-acyl-sn-glycerol-3-phosphate acyltransferase [Parvibium lacunae]
MRTAWLLSRSLVFLLVQAALTVLFGSLAFLTWPLPPVWRIRLIAVPWTRSVLCALRLICGIRVQVIGRENLPDAPVIVLSKHQSAWETLAYMGYSPRPPCFVFKKELLYIPFFGWGIGLMRMIAIDRSQGRNAFEQVVRDGLQRLQEGRWIIMFPEGTRIPVGQTGSYKTGGARLAIRTQMPVLPIAHNAGECWPKNRFIKQPGCITVSIGPLLSSRDKTPEMLNAEVESWIEAEMRRLNPERYPPNTTLLKQATTISLATVDKTTRA